MYVRKQTISVFDSSRRNIKTTYHGCFAKYNTYSSLPQLKRRNVRTTATNLLLSAIKLTAAAA